jgi:maltose-binding protein MalE
MPAAIEAAVYDGLSRSDQDALEGQAPEVFSDPAAAISWGLEQGCFKALQHARNAYDKLKREESPQDAHQMAALWVAEVRRRLRSEKNTS